MKLPLPLALALALTLQALSLPLAVPVLAAESVQDLLLPRTLTQAPAGLSEKLRVLAGRPQTPENALALGIMQALAKQYPQAAKTLEPLPGLLPAMAGWAGLYLGYAKFRQSDYQGALAALETVDATDEPIGPDALLLSAYCLEGLGSPLALERYRRFLALSGQPLRPAALWRAAAVAASGGDYPGAEGSLRELILTTPWTASAAKAEPLALELHRAGHISFDPDAPDSLRERIEVLLDKSQTAKAQTLIEQYAVSPGADPARALYLKGKALYARRDTQASIQLFEDAARLAKEPLLAAWAVYHQGRGYWRFSGPEDAARMDELLSEALSRAKALPGGPGGPDVPGRPGGPDGAELAEACRRLLLLARLERGRFQEALPMARELAASGPESTEAREQAAWFVGLIRYALADYPGAEAELSAFAAKYPDSDYAPGAIYWTARAREAAGNVAPAGEALREVLARWPNGYYGMLARQRLAVLTENAIRAGRVEQSPTETFISEQAAPTPAACPPPGGLALPEAAQTAEARADILTAGLLPELAESELAALNARLPKDPAVALRYARLATDLGDHQSAVRAVSRAFGPCLARGSQGELQPLRDIVYPNRYPDLISQNLAGTAVDPNLIRGLIRQESFFEPDAVSGAGAVGLMQVLPSTARTLAEKLGERGFKTETLKDPAVNIRYGVRYFLERYDEYNGNLALTLAGYNAGRVKIGVWREFLGGLDSELFVEFIPYTETRDYVKRILGNQAMYGMLY